MCGLCARPPFAVQHATLAGDLHNFFPHPIHSPARLPQIHFDIQYVGRLVKHAKRRVTFKFAFDGDTDEHSVVLMHTLNSGKKVVFLNGNEIYEEEQVGGPLVYVRVGADSI